MPRPPHSPWFDLPNDIWGWVYKDRHFTKLQISTQSYLVFVTRTKNSKFRTIAIFKSLDKTCMFVHNSLLYQTSFV
jgi:hypothetical protein